MHVGLPNNAEKFHISPNQCRGKSTTPLPPCNHPIICASYCITTTKWPATLNNIHPIMEIHARHSGHNHTVNIKYGYIILGISLFYALVLAVSKHVYLRKWKSQGRPNAMSVWARIGRVPVWAHIAIWTVVVVGLSFFKVEHLTENYSVIIKRVGRLGYALLPLDVLLAIRPSFLGGSYLDYISLHKWVLRFILVLLVLHGVGFFVKWLIDGAFWKKTLKWANLLGVIMSLISVLLGIISVRPVRRKIYRFFYVFHNFTILAFLVLIYLHARPGVGDFVILLVAMLAFQIYQKLSLIHNVMNVSIVDKDSSSLRLLRLSKPTQFPTLWYAGSHVRFGYAKSNIRFWLYPSHPYTLCSLPLDSTLDLVVKKGFRFQVFSSLEYTVSSPFESLPAPCFTSAQNVNILCGGSGISFGIPIFRYFKHNSSIKVNLFWCVSNKEDAYILSELKVTSEVQVYVTGNGDSTLFVNTDNNSDEGFGLLGENEQFELETLRSAQSDPFADAKAINTAPELDISFHKGRPKLDEIFLSFSETEDNANKWIIVCGPQSLINEAKAWSNSHDVQLFTELYDM